MKTIVRKGTNMSLYLVPDDMKVFVNTLITQFGEPAEFFAADCTADNTTLYENIAAPDDWKPCKYLFDGTAWTLNPDWVAPELSQDT
jgi:hypothetical protein